MDGAVSTVRVTKKPDGTMEGGSEFPYQRLFEVLRVVAFIAAFLGPLLVIAAAVQLVRLNRRNAVARVPLTPDQTIVFDQPGQYVMMSEGPRFSTAWWGLQFSLRNAAT